MIPEMYLRPGMAIGDCGGFTSRAICGTYSTQMDLPKQKNFYDIRRQFQGKDQPTDAHPEPDKTPPPRGQLIFGILLIGFVVLLFLLREKDFRADLAPLNQNQKAAPAAPAKH